MAISGRYRHVLAWRNREGVAQGETRAHVRGTSALEAEIAGLDSGVVGITIRMRQHPTISPGPGWEASHDGRTYHVKGSYDPTGKRRDITVIAVEAN